MYSIFWPKPNSPATWCLTATRLLPRKYALEQGLNPDAQYTFDCIAELYALEKKYVD